MPTSVFSDYSDYVISQLKTDGLVYITRDTLANIKLNYPAASNPDCMAVAIDLGASGVPVKSNGTNWVTESGVSYSIKSWSFKPYIFIGGQNSSSAAISYSQSGTTVTITHTSHGMTADLNGGEIYLTQNTGALISGWFTNWTYIDANSYSCTSSVSQSTSGLLGTNTSETVLNANYTIPFDLLMGNITTQMLFTRKVLTTGTKTLRNYFNGILVEATALTTATQWGNTNSASQGFSSATKYFSNGISAALETVVTPQYTSSVQLSVATTWAVVVPLAVTYVNRN